MRKSLGLLFFVALANGVLVYGCSSDPDAPPATDGTDASSEGGETGSITAEGGGFEDGGDSTDAKKDAKSDAKKDQQASDAIVEAAPDAKVYDPEGAPCGPLNTKETRPCEMCGEQIRLCLKATDGGGAGDGGLPGIWYPWGACSKPANAVCDPLQTYSDEACGNCGTRPRICQLDCTFVQGLTCQNEGECKAGTSDWEQLDCANLPDGGLRGRVKTCDNTCQYDIATACTAPPPNPNFILVNSSTVNTVFSKVFTWDANKKIKQIDLGSSFGNIAECPLPGFETSQVMYQFVEVRNTTAANLKVSIWHSSDAPAPKGADDSIMAVYAGPAFPRTDAERLNCVDFASDGCNTTAGATFNPVACGGGFSANAGLIKGETVTSGTYPGVTLNAGQSVTVYLAPYSSVGSAGNVKLNVKVQ